MIAVVKAPQESTRQCVMGTIRGIVENRKRNDEVHFFRGSVYKKEAASAELFSGFAPQKIGSCTTKLDHTAHGW